MERMENKSLKEITDEVLELYEIGRENNYYV